MTHIIRWALVASITLAVGLPGEALGQSSRERNRSSRDISPFSNDSAGGSNSSSSRNNRSSSRRGSSSSTSNSPTANPAANNSPNDRPGLGESGAKTVRGFTRTETTVRPGGAATPAGKPPTNATANGKPPLPGGKPALPGGKGPAGKGAPSGAGFGMSGKINEVTKSMADSLRPVRVDYDAEEMAEKPGVIILNPRRYRADEGQSRNSGKSSARRSDSMVRPL